MEIKIKKIKNDNPSEKLTKTKTPRKRIKKTAATPKIVLADVESKENEPVDTYVTETLSDIEDQTVINEVNNVDDEPIMPGMKIDFLEWTYNLKEKSTIFYLILFSLAVGFIYFSYKYNNWMLALIVILGFVMIAQKNAKIEKFRIDQTGVYIQDQQLVWANILNCSIEKLNESTSLITVTPNVMMRSKIYIPFNKGQEREILYLINKYSKFTDPKSSTFDQIIKWIIF